MKNLLIDTSSDRIILAVYQDLESIYEMNVENGHDLSTRIFPLIDELFTKAKVSADEITRIYAVNGPGSFTGVRIGVTIAKTMAWALNKEIVPISELELMASTEVDTSYKVPYIDARRDAVFAGIYDHNNKVILEEQYITIEELLKQITNLDDVTFLGYTELPFGKKVQTPKVNIKEIIKRHELDIPMNPHNVNPNYLKRTEAEENLEKVQND